MIFLNMIASSVIEDLKEIGMNTWRRKAQEKNNWGEMFSRLWSSKDRDAREREREGGGRFLWRSLKHWG